MKALQLGITVALALTVMTMSASLAQESATIQALATVVSTLHITGITNLNFGTVTLGINKSVNKNQTGQAGQWDITGNPSSEIDLDFTLPAQLRTTDSAAFMNISFGSTDASYDDGTGGGQSSPAGVLNPNGPSTHDLGTGGLMSVWIGGTVHPSISQTAGDYAADIILTVAYTGS
jgi:hypothetical protein